MLKFNQKIIDFSRITKQDYIQEVPVVTKKIMTTQEGYEYSAISSQAAGVNFMQGELYYLQLKVQKTYYEQELILKLGNGTESLAQDYKAFYYSRINPMSTDSSTITIECIFSPLLDAENIVLQTKDSDVVTMEIVGTPSVKQIKNKILDFVSDNEIIKRIVIRGNQDLNIVLNESLYFIPPSGSIENFDKYNIYKIGLPFVNNETDGNMLIDYWYEEV